MRRGEGIVPSPLEIALATLPAEGSRPVVIRETAGQLIATAAPDVPFVPTPIGKVREMLSLARVTPDDLVCDLGSGNGRIVLTAAAEFGARGVGVDIDPTLIAESRRNAEAAGVMDRVEFIEGDLFELALTQATVITLALLPSLNLRLRSKLFQELRPGSRVVSSDFHMGDWVPDRTLDLTRSQAMPSCIHVWMTEAATQAPAFARHLVASGTRG
jgi:SAM-dependent methyltransferase